MKASIFNLMEPKLKIEDNFYFILFFLVVVGGGGIYLQHVLIKEKHSILANPSSQQQEVKES